MAEFENVPIEQIDGALEKLGDMVGLLRVHLAALHLNTLEMQVGGTLPVFPRPSPIPFTGGTCDGFEFILRPHGGGTCGPDRQWQDYIAQITAFLTALFAGLEGIDWQPND